MATAFYKENMMQILEEMRQLFPQVPEHIIQSCVSQCQSDRNACRRLLEMYASPNRSDKNVYGAHRNMMRDPRDVWHNVNSPPSSRSQSFSATGHPNMQDYKEKPQSAPVRNEIPLYHPGDFPSSSYYQQQPQYTSSRQYPQKHISTFEIPPRHLLELCPPTPAHLSPHLSISINTNGPSASHHHMQRPLNANYPKASSPRTSPRPQGSPVARNDRETFVQALLKYQENRHQQLYLELNQGKDTLQNLKREVEKMEESLQNRKTYGGNMNSTSGEALQSMRNEITKLRVECHCLSVEADICSKDQTQQGGDFYHNIFTGQVGPIPPVPSNDNNGNRVEDNEGSKWKCLMCTFHNHPALNSCEMCEMPRKQID